MDLLDPQVWQPWRQTPRLPNCHSKHGAHLLPRGAQQSPREAAVCKKEDPRFKFIRLARNVGHQLAVAAGLDVATG